MIDHIERELDQKLGCEAVIHMDPIETNNAAIAQMQQQVEQKVLEIDRRITIHDFRPFNVINHVMELKDIFIPRNFQMQGDHAAAGTVVMNNQIMDTVYFGMKMSFSSMT